MARIAIDMDHVIADAHNGLLDWLERSYSVKPSMTPGQRFRDVLNADQYAALSARLETAEFFFNLKPLESSIDTLELLQRNHEVFITTAAMFVPNSFGAKYEWIKKYLPFFEPKRIVFCGDKSIISADYLIDDHIHNFENFEGRGLLFSALHNELDSWPDRLSDWNDIGNFNF